MRLVQNTDSVLGEPRPSTLRRLTSWQFSVAWSIVFSVFAVLGAVLWARSYRTIDVITLQPGYSLALRCRSAFGAISVQWSDPRVMALQLGLHVFPMSAEQISNDITTDDPLFKKLFRLHLDSTRFTFSIFYAEMVAISLVAAAWVRWSWRFSLQTLFTAFALVSILLGTMVASKQR